VTQLPAQRTTEIALALVNLRQGPSMDSKIIKVLKKGTKLMVLQEKGGWLRVQLEDGTEGWVGRSMTSEGSRLKNP
jgi:SH3-like domain-containing protein